MNYKRKCIICKSYFETNVFNKKCCCKKCTLTNNKNLNKKYMENKYIKIPLKNRVCVKCGIIFDAKSGNQIFCSKECRAYCDIKKICPICNKEFSAKRKDIMFCSEECRNINKKNKAIEYNNILKSKKSMIKCKQCNKLFYTDKHNKIYCSRECKEIYNKSYMSEYRLNNNKKCKASYRKHYLKNRDNILINNKKNRKELLKYEKEYRSERKKRDPAFKIKYNIQNQLRTSLSNLGNRKIFRTFKTLGYTAKDLESHLESKFKEGMSWNNHGNDGWHIDHIKPIAAFKLIKEDGELDIEQIKLCWALENLQPLWAKENISKGSWYEVDGKMCRFSNGEIIEIREDNS